jgi:pimeloyl-ACP methyl ester carboxylesterase
MSHLLTPAIRRESGMHTRLLCILLTLCLYPALESRAQEPATIASIPVNPLSLSGLRELANSAPVNFKSAYERPPLDGILRRVVTFDVDGLQQFALILEPAGTAPVDGWPVLLMNHGHHPDPPQYGRVASGETDRPGDYYRALPMAFAQQGFMVVVPDFRGHNDSEGTKFAKGPLESNWYSRDSIVAFLAIDSIPRASNKYRFMWGHSMGGAVTLRALLALQSKVKGASIWSSTTSNPMEGSLYYSLSSADTSDSLTTEKPALSRLRSDINSLPFKFKPEQGDARAYIDELETPLSIHHSVLDLNSTPYYWSVQLAGKLYASDKPYFFYSYAGDKHLFEGKNLLTAIERDVLFFKNLINIKDIGTK